MLLDQRVELTKENSLLLSKVLLVGLDLEDFAD